MKEFMMIFRNEPPTGEMPNEEQMTAVMNHWQDWIKSLATKGNFSGTGRLLPEGKLLRPGQVITDGPYAEVKEMVGGYVIVKADSFDKAVELARECPNLAYGGSVEVRSMMTIEMDPKSADFLKM